MDIVRTEGVVLRYTNFKEADRMLTVFSPAKGKMQVLARGCRKPSSKLLAASQVFCYADYVFIKSKEIYIATQAEIKNSFYNIRNRVERLAYGTYILNLTEEAVNYDESNFRLFYMLLHTLSHLAYGEAIPEDITHIFELKLIDLLGYRPVLDRCLSCGQRLEGNPLFFSVSEGGIICPQCNSDARNGYTIHRGTLQTMRYILDVDIRRLGGLKFSQLVRDELDTILSHYLSYRLEKTIKARQFINQIKGGA